MLPLSIVILTKNEESNIVRCLESVKGLSDDILVIDSGSTDQTIALATMHQATVISTPWLGYGATKNFGNSKAKYPWILSLDADEEVNETLRLNLISIFSAELKSELAFKIQRKMVYAGITLNHGSVSNEFRIRLFNVKNARWNLASVHEDIEFSTHVDLRKIDGFLWHHSFKNEEDHLARLEKYAQLSAQGMYEKKKKVTWIKRFVSPTFNLIKNYVFKRGFLDGKAGLQFALHEMWYVKRKYQLLHSMHNPNSI